MFYLHVWSEHRLLLTQDGVWQPSWFRGSSCWGWSMTAYWQLASTHSLDHLLAWHSLFQTRKSQAVHGQWDHQQSQTFWTVPMSTSLVPYLVFFGVQWLLLNHHSWASECCSQQRAESTAPTWNRGVRYRRRLVNLTPCIYCLMHPLTQFSLRGKQDQTAVWLLCVQRSSML